ncbi:methylated-DNA--[protein]-cysteine S-methyltransferase [Cytophagaceae bacterium DM2B3-1]|uniref:methylated-DNA--[protein]-cysteine S-methyltransferase n=2 Tax=Xanthocytophaga TaxID=3078918 RepID=A0AAE3QKM7_9BACT|nr:MULTISPECIES: methylated-DNA--[protein]-cysteine S-methyltransferase [Xanthocytophaga]MDJ1469085.1 methylated-DNA--[protein]-cysteine S-methyltransferase [Xanthocytophaga flavus]MDJ1481117.1 methylated-DNA--[protein]-cysteine S-methyltransferase [Xanthocytophaga flavus]MDJ1497369.1 methylated-DNA--[protein]-cysteine S-methyltransferase [Xanthocytophaga flavus]MDJ1504730.1 methylated-DNA--[protein]-cysteine S-methyltransferase [Xanthocytophaga agilis]
MNTQEQIHYNRIAEAIDYIRQNFKDQPNLDEVAEKVHLSPFHFQRLFTDWAGVSPKKFLQYISIEHAKQILKNRQVSLSEAAYETGLSGTSRLHDLFVTIEGMTPGEFKNGGENLSINYSYAESPFGNIIVASTAKGICYMAFAENEQIALQDLQQHFPNARFRQMLDLLQQNALYIFTHDWSKLDQVRLHLKGTDFQLKVWEALLRIPMGHLSTYGEIAGKINQPNASRAVGTAIGSNPVAFLIPCHRVIQASGTIGGYMWGSTRKTAMIGWEAAKTIITD